jgi:hypothetical protein
MVLKILNDVLAKIFLSKILVYEVFSRPQPISPTDTILYGIKQYNLVFYNILQS